MASELPASTGSPSSAAGWSHATSGLHGFAYAGYGAPWCSTGARHSRTCGFPSIEPHGRPVPCCASARPCPRQRLRYRAWLPPTLWSPPYIWAGLLRRDVVKTLEPARSGLVSQAIHLQGYLGEHVAPPIAPAKRRLSASPRPSRPHSGCLQALSIRFATACKRLVNRSASAKTQRRGIASGRQLRLGL